MDFSHTTDAQELSIKHLEGPLLISAGAGSGKTFTLTQRVAWAMLPGSGEAGAPFLNSIDDVLVITFTEKAAGEIKDRIRSTLRAEGMVEEALKVDAAWISTIHGMCARILREHALEIGMDPAFRVLDFIEEDELRTGAIMDVLERMEEGPASPYRALLDAVGITNLAKYLTELLTEASRLADGLDHVEFGPAGTALSVQVRAMLEEAESLMNCENDNARAEASLLADQLATYLEGEEDPTQLAEIVRGVNLGNMRAKAAANLNAAVKSMRLAVRVAPYCEHTQQLVALAREVQAGFEAALAQSGQIDMAGLIRRTLATFETYPAIAARYTSRFKLIMVDEFQDTSQLQINMIERIAGEAKQRLCTVGDAQQSIYRFQGADVGVYMNHKRDMRASGAEVVELDTNFRSHEDVLAFVRRLCGQPGFFQEDFLDLQPGSDGRPFKAAGPRIELALTKHAWGKADPAVEQEAAYIARRFAAFREAGHTANEMVVLMGRLNNAHIYAQAMRDAGFACVVTGGSHYFDAAHVQVCQNILDALANPFNSESLLMLLTSEALPVTSEDLLYLSTKRNEADQLVRQDIAWGFLPSGVAPEQASPLLEHATRVLHHAWDSLGKVRPAQLFMQVVLESGWLGRLQAGGIDAQAKAADVLKFARLVEDAQSKAGFDMARVAYTMREAAVSSSEKPGALSLENLDAVRIMTVHASKGLEFPIVAVADCYGNATHGSALALYNEGSNLFVSLQGPGGNSDFVPTDAGLQGASEPAEFRANMLAINTQKEYEEKKRLLYVACTRASAALLLAVRAQWTKKNGYSQVVKDILSGIFPGEEDFPEQDCAVEFGGTTPLAFTVIEVPEQDERGESGLQDEQGASGSQDARGVPGSQDAQDTQDAQPLQSPQPTQETIITFPALTEPKTPALYPMRTRSDFFSYSSLAHAHDNEADTTQSNEADTNYRMSGEDFVHLGFEEGSLQPAPSEASPHPAADADKATDFGSALHRACELWARGRGYRFMPESTEALEGLNLKEHSENSGLLKDEETLQIQDNTDTILAHAAAEFDVQDTARLRAAFERWQNSEARTWAFSFDTQQPELPFVAAVGEGVLEGEIDLFCSSGKTAGIIDYKTGGSPQETPELLHEKHLLQAQCYAYATLSAGFENVELRFVRVEQESAENPGQPQVVSYAFSRADIASLEAAIAALL